MSSFQSRLTAISNELQNILQAKARNLPYTVSTLLFRMSYGSSLVLSDSNNEQYYVDETYLSSFRDIYTNRAYKFLRLDDWELQIHFQKRSCKQIDIICTSATFIANKIETRHIAGCCIKLNIITNPKDSGKLSNRSVGFLRRISKKNICQQSMKSLIGFIPKAKKQTLPFYYKPWKQQQQPINPLQTLNPLGVQALHKLRHFISKQQIRDFVINHEVSKQASEELEKLISSKKAKKQQQT